MLLALSAFLLFGSAAAPDYKRLIVFEGSDWCNNCIRLEDNILSDEAFTDFLEQNQITLERIDFPQRKKLNKEQTKYNRSIAEQLNFEGIFPTLVLCDHDLSTKKKLRYANQNTEEFICLIEKEAEQLH